VCVGGGGRPIVRGRQKYAPAKPTKRSGFVRRLAKLIGGGGGGREGIIILIVMEAANGMPNWQGLLSCEPLPTSAAVIWLLFSTISNHAWRTMSVAKCTGAVLMHITL
jgi:hypothetical protein